MHPSSFALRRSSGRERGRVRVVAQALLPWCDASGSLLVSYGDFLDTIRDCRDFQRQSREAALKGELGASVQRMKDILMSGAQGRARRLRPAHKGHPHGALPLRGSG
eukprot:1185331-Prorocentrum_minimum.AAC.2